MKLLDNSCISLFILEIPQYDFLNELHDLNESLNITSHVKREFESTGSADKLKFYLSNNLINMKEIEYNSLLKRRYPYLGEGELSIIQWGLNLKEHCSYYCVLDDLRARNIAKKLNLTISGSIGLIILVLNKKDYSSSEIDGIIEAIDKSNFRINKKILSKLRN